MTTWRQQVGRVSFAERLVDYPRVAIEYDVTAQPGEMSGDEIGETDPIGFDAHRYEMNSRGAPISFGSSPPASAARSHRPATRPMSPTRELQGEGNAAEPGGVRRRADEVVGDTGRARARPRWLRAALVHIRANVVATSAEMCRFRFRRLLILKSSGGDRAAYAGEASMRRLGAPLEVSRHAGRVHLVFATR